MRQKRNEEQNVLGIYLAIAGLACLCVGASVCTFPMGLGPALFACRVPHPLATFPGVFFKRKILSGKAEKSQQWQWQRRRRRRRLWQLKIIFAARAFLAATHVRASHASYARRSFNIGKTEARLGPI